MCAQSSDVFTAASHVTSPRLTDAAAKAGEDFIARENYILSFTDVGADPSSGVVSSTHTRVQTREDTIAEGTESFICALRLTVSPSDPLKSTDPDTITVSIIDNDSESVVCPSVCVCKCLQRSFSPHECQACSCIWHDCAITKFIMYHCRSDNSLGEASVRVS